MSRYSFLLNDTARLIIYSFILLFTGFECQTLGFRRLLERKNNEIASC